MTHRVYMNIKVAIDVDGNSEDEAWRQAQDFLNDNVPDVISENIIDTHFIRAQKIETEVIPK